jgi:hypothetical protein
MIGGGGTLLPLEGSRGGFMMLVAVARVVVLEVVLGEQVVGEPRGLDGPWSPLLAHILGAPMALGHRSFPGSHLLGYY